MLNGLNGLNFRCAQLWYLSLFFVYSRGFELGAFKMVIISLKKFNILRDSIQCPSEWMSRMQPLSYSVTNLGNTTPPILNQIQDTCYVLHCHFPPIATTTVCPGFFRHPSSMLTSRMRTSSRDSFKIKKQSAYNSRMRTASRDSFKIKKQSAYNSRLRTPSRDSLSQNR